jgi:hypothetical protein
VYKQADKQASTQVLAIHTGKSTSIHSYKHASKLAYQRSSMQASKQASVQASTQADRQASTQVLAIHTGKSTSIHSYKHASKLAYQRSSMQASKQVYKQADKQASVHGTRHIYGQEHKHVSNLANRRTYTPLLNTHENITCRHIAFFNPSVSHAILYNIARTLLGHFFRQVTAGGEEDPYVFDKHARDNMQTRAKHVLATKAFADKYTDVVTCDASLPPSYP